MAKSLVELCSEANRLAEQIAELEALDLTYEVEHALRRVGRQHRRLLNHITAMPAVTGQELRAKAKAALVALDDVPDFERPPLIIAVLNDVLRSGD